MSNDLIRDFFAPLRTCANRQRDFLELNQPGIGSALRQHFKYRSPVPEDPYGLGKVYRFDPINGIPEDQLVPNQEYVKYTVTCSDYTGAAGTMYFPRTLKTLAAWHASVHQCIWKTGNTDTAITVNTDRCTYTAEIVTWQK